MTWIEDRKDWEIQYEVENERGSQRGVRYLPLPETATEEDAVNFFREEGVE